MVVPLLLLSTIILSSPALAADADILITGRGLGAAVGESVYGSVVIGRERLTGSASGQLDEILKDVPGFQLFRRSDARSANPTSQGATLRGLGGNASSRALLMLDGVPQSDPFGGWINWPAFDPWRLGEVRVVRGGGSGANGPGALAGTIELHSAAPSDLRGATGSIAYGSRDSLELHGGLGITAGASFVTLSGAFGRGDGFVPVVAGQRGAVDRRSPYRQGSAALRLVAPLPHGTELQASGRWFSDRRERGTAFSANRTTGADASLRLVGRRWTLLGYVQERDYDNSFASVAAGRATVARTAEQYAVPSTGLGARFEVRPAVGRRLEVRLGGDWRRTDGETKERYFFQNGAALRGRTAGGRSDTFGLFAEGALELGDWTLAGGVRADRWRLGDGSLSERVLASGAVLTDLRFADRSGWEPTARAGAAWAPTGQITLRSAAYLGWRLPTLNELYRPFRVGADATAANPALDPERLRGIEGALDYRPLPTARLSLALFANRLENGIANVTLGQGPGQFAGVGFVGAGGQYRQRRNLGSIDVQGIEIDGRLDLGALALSAGYSFADAQVRADGPARPLDGLRPAQTPRHSLAATLAWRGSGSARAALATHYSGSQYEDDLNQRLLPDALTLEASGSLPLSRRIGIDLRAENIFDERVVAGISGDGVIERATPRTLWIGLHLRR